MAQLRPRTAAVLLALALVSAFLLVAWLTRTPAPDRAPPPGAEADREAPRPAAPAPPAAAAPAPASCPPELAREVLPGPAFSEPWAMCRLFGNHDAGSGTSRLAGALARVVLSRGLPERVERHVLVIAREATGADGEVVRGRGSALSLSGHVFEHAAGGWRLAASGEVGGPFEHGALPRLEVLRVGPARHGLLAGGVLPDQASLYALSEPGLPVLIPNVPRGGSNAARCEPLRCFEWKAELTFERGRDPDYDDAVVRVTGTRPDDDERVWPVDETLRWVRRGGRYVPQP